MVDKKEKLDTKALSLFQLKDFVGTDDCKLQEMTDNIEAV